MAGGRHHPASQPWPPGRQYRRDPTLTPKPNPEPLPPTNYVGSSYLQTPRPRVTASAQSAQPFSPYAGYSSQPNYSDGSSNAWDAHGRASAFTVNVKTRPLPPQTGWNVSLVSAMRKQPGPGIPLARRESDAASYSSGTTVRSTSLHRCNQCTTRRTMTQIVTNTIRKMIVEDQSGEGTARSVLLKQRGVPAVY